MSANIVAKFKIQSICQFLKNVSDYKNRDAFMKLMKFTKQSPSYYVEEDEYLSIVSDVSADKYGYKLVDHKLELYGIKKK